MTPEQKAEAIISDLNARSMWIDYLDDELQEEIKNMMIEIINK